MGVKLIRGLRLADLRISFSEQRYHITAIVVITVTRHFPQHMEASLTCATLSPILFTD